MNASLSPRDAVPSAHALAIAVARRTGVRALLIKGPTAHAHGLRAARVSADADVLIAPDEAVAYLAALERCGWKERPSTAAHGPTADHSFTLIHAGWPCDIDVHTRFPGFLESSAVTFESLWRRREALVLAGVEADMVDRASAILIAALHALRTPAQTSRHADEIRLLAEGVLPELSRAEQDDLVALARATGAVDTARPLLERLDAMLPPPARHGEIPALDAWRSRVGGRGETLAQWMPVLGRAAWRDRLGLAMRMIWPSDAQFRTMHPETEPSLAASVRGRWARIGRGLRAAPRVVWGRVMARRGVTDGSLLR
ncbi:hypothetical protein [Demequina rhizosphaerae]|uniref:hypothetical protein n=1 Tax=Demequina rhizosphaerae TaxID=1638985 RepID=UPI000780743B|nr:hypothetical protein [Demequina rhizosphaerae]